MPLPVPTAGEDEQSFVSRCAEELADEFNDQDQRLAVCYRQWRDEKGTNSMDNLLKAIKARKPDKFGYGIMTADVYVRTLAERAGLAACYEIASTRSTSFDDVLQKASRTLVYSDPEMQTEEKESSVGNFKRLLDGAPKDLELPKNTLMVVRHKLTTDREDRDGDVLHPEGVEVDPKMLLLWQHVHTMPIGKMLYIVGQDEKAVRVVSAVVDMNETTHDAAVMIDNGMGRYSHGFRSIQHEKRKDAKGVETGGFEIHKAEIMEASLVSVPANVDADTEEVLLSLVEGGKLTSPMMKAVGKSIREHRPATVGGVTIKFREELGDYRRELSCGSLQDLQTAVGAGLIGTKGEDDEDRRQAGNGEAGGRGEEAPAAASEETDDGQGAGEGEKGQAGNDQMKALTGSFEQLREELDRATSDGAKAGRVLSANNESKLREALDDLQEFARHNENIGDEARRLAKTAMDALEDVLAALGEEKAGKVLSAANEAKVREALSAVRRLVDLGLDLPRSAKVLLKDTMAELDAVLRGLGPKEEASAEQAGARYLAAATIEQMKTMRDACSAMIDADERARKTKRFARMAGKRRLAANGSRRS